MRRRSSSSIAANPVLIGAATVLVIVVAVFLSYNANKGLPFVPTYDLKADVPSAAQLTPGNEVRIGGTRIGVVNDISPVTLPNGRVIARVDMKLETVVQPLPRDTTVLIRSRSALGLKYVELTRGRASQGMPAGTVMSLRQATPTPVEFDEALSTFDDKTRAAARTNITEFGNALAGRGADLNQAISSLSPLLQTLTPVANNLANPDTQLGQFVQSLGQLTGELAPVAGTQGALFRNLDTTFTALAGVARPSLQDSISGAPAALDAVTNETPRIRPVLANAAELAGELRPGVRALRIAAPDLASALTTGTPVLRRSIGLSARLEPTFRTLRTFATTPSTRAGIQDLTGLSQALAPTVAQIAPTQTVCNQITLLARNAASTFSEDNGNGTNLRFNIIAAPRATNSEGGPSSGPASGGAEDSFLHSNPYPNTAAPGQVRECEAGNEGFTAGTAQVGNVPGDQGVATEDTTDDTATTSTTSTTANGG